MRNRNQNRNRGPRRAFALAALTAALVATISACGEREENLSSGSPTELSLLLDFFVNPDHAGIYTGLARGDFDEAGLKVNPEVPSDPASPLRLLAAGQVDLAISYEPEVILARDQGLDVVAVASIVDQPLTSLISLPKGGIADPHDLDKKTIATAGIGYQDAFLSAILGGVGLETNDVKAVDVGFNLEPPLISGSADAILGGFRNVEGVELRLRGLKPRIVPVDQLGVPTYDELVLVVNRKTLEEDPEPIRLFISALEQGTLGAIDSPELATETILDASDGLDPAITKAEIDATLPLLAPEPGHPFGELDPDEWGAFAAFMADQGLTERRWTSAELIDNSLLPSSDAEAGPTG